MRRPARLFVPLLVAVLAAAATSCTDDRIKTVSSDTTPRGGTATTGVDDDPFEWEEFGNGLETGHLTVPVDYDDPSKGTLDLFLARHLADPRKRIGSLLVNPGGPGFGGSDLAIQAAGIYNRELVERFDIIGWDPRGTGLSEPAIDCIDDYDRFYTSSDITPDSDAERNHIVDVAEEFADDCAAKNADILQHVGTNNSARDINAIREALGEDKISYFGWSYGSELGATWATMFPDTVRAAVLDGAADPDAGYIESGVQQTKGFEATFATFLAKCSDDENCAFHNDGHAEAALDALWKALDEDPIPSERGRPEVNLQVAITAAAQAMYSEQLWRSLATALADAQRGDGRGLLALYDMYYDRRDDGTYNNSLEAFQTIFCMDAQERLTVKEEDAAAKELSGVAPRMAPGSTGSYFCTFFPESTHPRIEITGKGAGPILVMGTTGDAATPLESTRAMADTLEDGRLVIVTANQHTGYNVNNCSGTVVDDCLIDPENKAPADGTKC